jgi:hypothetical protein
MIAKNTGIRRITTGKFRATARKNPRHGRVRLLVASALALLFAVTTAARLCEGWAGDAEQRAACCARMQQHCATWSSDDCCADGEQRQNRDLVRTIPQPARDMTAGAVVAPLTLIVTPGSALAVRTSGPAPHLLNSVFLI